MPAKAKMKPEGWDYEEVPVRQDLKTQLADDWKVQAYKVTSGDSAEKYYVHLLHLSKRPNNKIGVCNCRDAQFLQIPLIVTGQITAMCKHARFLVEFLDAEK